MDDFQPEDQLALAELLGRCVQCAYDEDVIEQGEYEFLSAMINCMQTEITQ